MITIDPATDPFIQKTIRRKATQLTSRAVFSDADPKDLEQELLTHLIVCLDRYDESIGHLRPFAVSIIDRHCRNLLRKRLTGKRLTREPVESLNVSVKAGDGGSCDFSQLVTSADGDRRLALQRRHSEEELTNLRQDLAAVISKLPEPWQELLEHCKSLTLCEAAQVMGIPRTTLTDWMKQIQERFKEAGLENYFQE